jgi:hypothetical protein
LSNRPVAEIEVLELGDEEFGAARRDVVGVPPRGGLDHLRRPVHRREPAAVAALADEAGRHAVPAADLQDAIVGLHVERVHDCAQARTHEVMPARWSARRARASRLG